LHSKLESIEPRTCLLNKIKTTSLDNEGHEVETF
jgi:hypothetical protein